MYSNENNCVYYHVIPEFNLCHLIAMLTYHVGACECVSVCTCVYIQIVDADDVTLKENQ